MADQIKEISNGTYTIGALSNGVPIASTNATTEYVVKDIHVQNNQLTAVGANLNFNVNNVTAASLNSSVAGSEIIDVSSTAVAVASPAAFTVANFENWMRTDTAGSRINTITNRLVNGVLSTSAISQSAVISTTPNANSNIVGWATIGSNFYYWTDDGNSVQNLYRRAGGVNGTETTIANISSYMPIVFNGVDKFHWVSSTQIWTHNATTNTNTSVSLDTASTGWPGTLASYPRASFANGLVFLMYNGGSSAWAINPTTGRMSTIFVGSSTDVNLAFSVYHTGGTYYFLITGNVSAGSTGPLAVRTISDTVVGPLTSANTFGSSTLVYSLNTYTPRNPLTSHWPKMSPSGDFVFMSVETSGSIYVYKRFNVVTQTFASSFTIDVSTITPNASIGYSVAPFRVLSVTDDSANKLNTTFYPQSVTLRVTGVETTL